MPKNKSIGTIAIKDGARINRQRFTIAHELGHFINCGHQPARNMGDDSFGFHCTKRDMKAREWGRAKRITDSQRKEVEANRFAAELLMPKYKLAPYLRPAPNLKHVVRIAQDLDVSPRRLPTAMSKPMTIRSRSYLAKMTSFATLPRMMNFQRPLFGTSRLCRTR